MNCKEFQKALTPKTPTLYAYDANNNAEYSRWFNHRIECKKCSDLFMKTSLVKHKIRTANYPCIHIAYYVNDVDKTLENHKGEYGVPGPERESYTIIFNCPWCGKKL